MNRHLAPACGATALGMLLLQPVTTLADPPAHARNENSAQHRGYAQSPQRYDDDREERGDFEHHRRDTHEHYPRRGYVVHRLPHGARVVHHHGHRYYYGRGAWYQPYGPRYVVIDPPVGLVVPFLPWHSTTMYFGGTPHHRAGPVYYVWDPRARGYLVTGQRYRR